MAEGVVSSRGAARQVTCVVWHTEANALRPELLAALKRPGFSLQTADHAFDAGAMALASQAAAPRGPDQSPLVVLVLVEPVRLEGALELVQMLMRFAPSVVLWQFDPGDAPHQLRRVRSTDMERWKQAQPQPTQVSLPEVLLPEVSLPEIKVTQAFKSGPLDDVAVLAVPEPKPGEPTRHVLSDEELSMLLDAEPREMGEERLP
ncbi:MAG: hypothetical protein NTV94_05190 [Planctomycetota bacterium]|nr:hypothetical protein [Planctomycetota bacterium]